MAASHTLSLGGLNKTTGKYVYPKIANKADQYVCPDCNKDLTLCQGEIRIPYFRHKIDAINPCNHYSSPSESQIHKDAKFLLKELLDSKTLFTMTRLCSCCGETDEFDIPDMTDDSVVELEHRFTHNDGVKIADVAYLNKGQMVCIFEICHTHKTGRENRPEPWFEIDAQKLIAKVNDKLWDKTIPCIRCEKCEECVEKKAEENLKRKNLLISKSSFNETQSYECNSSGIMEILIDIICGKDDAYYKWSNIFQPFYDSDEPENFNNAKYENFNNAKYEIINDEGTNFKNGCRVKYDINLIKQVNNLCIYNIIDSLYVDKGCVFIHLNCSQTSGNILLKCDVLRKLCCRLFGCCGDTEREINEYCDHCEEHEIKIKSQDKDKNYESQMAAIKRQNTPKPRDKMPGIDTYANVYLNVKYAQKDDIKDIGGRWDKNNKLWYISVSKYYKNKDYICETFGEPIVWMNDESDSDEICPACNGSGTSYWSDDCYGSCLECCCINCSEFNNECQCKYCEKCESNYLKDEIHECYLCEKCGKYEQYECSIQDHCKECCVCNKLTKTGYLRTNGKCGSCYDGSNL